MNEQLPWILRALFAILNGVKHATWDQIADAGHFILDRNVPAPAKAVLLLINTGMFLAVIVVWCVTHALLPFLIFSFAEDLFLAAIMVSTLLCSAWFFNMYSRSTLTVGSSLGTFVDSRRVVPPRAISEDLRVEGEGVRERTPDGVRRDGE